MFENLRKDYRTYNGHILVQGFWVMVVYRFGNWRYRIRWTWLRKPFSLIYKLSQLAVQVLTGIEFPCEVKVGDHLRFDHFGGIIVSGYAVLGSHCIVRNGVSIGLKNVDEPCAPVIGDYCNIGAGAKILGNIRIGDHVDIGANAVVLQDVPSHSLAVGVPARIIPKKERPSMVELPGDAGSITDDGREARAATAVRERGGTRA